MPSGKTHLIISVILTVFLGLMFRESLGAFGLLLLPLTVVYGIIPDIDSRASRIRNTLLTITFVIISITALINHAYLIISIIFLSVFWLIVLFSKHRGFFHSIPFGIIIALPLIVFSLPASIIGFINYTAHIALDKVFKN